jgi:hypothetical protein
MTSIFVSSTIRSMTHHRLNICRLRCRQPRVVVGVEESPPMDEQENIYDNQCKHSHFADNLDINDQGTMTQLPFTEGPVSSSPCWTKRKIRMSAQLIKKFFSAAALAAFIAALLCIHFFTSQIHIIQNDQSQQQSINQLIVDTNKRKIRSGQGSKQATEHRSRATAYQTIPRGRRHLLNIFNTDNNPCNIQRPPPNDGIPPPTYFATFPGTGSRITRNLLKAMTAHRVHDESELNRPRRTNNVIFIQTRYPHKSGQLVQFDSEVTKGIILIRNPMHALTSLFDELYARKKHLPIKFQNADRRYKDGGPSIQDWISWRDRLFETQLLQYGEFVRYWMRRYRDEERIIISYEDLVNDRGGGEGEKEVMRLAQFVRRIRDVYVDLDSVSCIWRTVVLNGGGDDDDGGDDGRRDNNEEGPDGRRQLSSYISPHPSSIGAELAQRPFTVEQLRTMVTMLQELAFEFQHNVLLYGNLINYHRDVMDLAKYMTTFESNEPPPQQQQVSEQLPPAIPSSDNNPASAAEYQQRNNNMGSISTATSAGTTLDGRTFHVFTSSPPRSDSAFLTNWIMGLLGSGTDDYVKLITDPILDVLQNGMSVPIETTAVTHTNEIDLISLYKIFKPSFDEVFFVVSSGLDSEVCEYSNVLCVKYEEQLFTKDEHLTFLVQSLTQRFQEQFAYFFGPPANLSVRLDTGLAEARLRDMAAAEKAMEIESYEIIHPKYGVRGRSKRLADTAYTTSRNPNHTRRLFYCGSYGTPDKRRDSVLGIFFVNSFFPEIQGCAPGIDDCRDVAIKLTQDTLSAATPDDFLVYQMHQYCEVDVLSFPGMQLHINAGYYDLHPRHGLNLNGQYTFDYLPPKDNIYVMGAHEDGPRSIQLPYMLMKWWALAKGSKAEIYKPNIDSLFVPSARPKNTRKHFLLYANSYYVDYREKAVMALSSIGPIHALGKCEGNVDAVPQAVDAKPLECIPFQDGSRPPSVVIPDWITRDNKLLNKRTFNEFRFVIAMESVKSPGYITDKILNAFMAGAIPIYYGTTQIFGIFNPKAFIFYDIENPQLALDRIAYLESNPDAYEEMLNEPILAHGDETIEKYFSFDDSIGNGAFKRRVREKLGFPL